MTRKIGNTILVAGLCALAYGALAFWVFRDLPPNNGASGRRLSGYVFIAGLASTYLGMIVRRIAGYCEDSSRPRFQFSMRFILFWLVPYAAIVSAVLAWDGPYDKAFLNWNARINILTVLTGSFVSALSVLKFRRMARESNEKPT